jgi:hypothetical protein
MSREAAAECSPGRKPGVFGHNAKEPAARAADDLNQEVQLILGIITTSCRPSGAPTILPIRTPGLRPGLHSAAASRLIE